MNMLWEELFQSFASARRDNSQEEAAQCVSRARRRLATNSSEEWDLLGDALQDGDRKWLRTQSIVYWIRSQRSLSLGHGVSLCPRWAADEMK